MNWKAVTKVVKKASRAGEKTLRRAEKETSRVAKLVPLGVAWECHSVRLSLTPIAR